MENDALAARVGPWMESVEPYLPPLASVAKEFTALTGVPVDLPAALFLRAALAGHNLPGRTSAGGSCHLLEAADGWTAVNLSRPDDLAAVPALVALLSGAEGEPLHEVAKRTTAAEIAASAQLLGIAAAEHASASGPPVRTERLGEPSVRAPATLRIVDLSALWAGPLCARLLGLAGARVTKVESTTRPDGARAGSPAFYRWLHEGHDSLVLDFASGALAEAVAGADIVIEASRARALRRLGVHAEEFLAARPGRIWLSITGYGRDDDRIAFGDDAAVAGGLTGLDAQGDPVFLGDALADPVTGIHAAHATAHSLASGGGELLSVAMSACAASMVPSPC